MCHTYVQSVGYVCFECKSEFKEYLQKNELNPTTEGQITKEWLPQKIHIQMAMKQLLMIFLMNVQVSCFITANALCS
jgi:hypothetical protein